MKILETHPDGAAPNPALVGLDRLPEVMRDGAAPAQTQDIATMTDTNTVHGGAVAPVIVTGSGFQTGVGGFQSVYVDGRRYSPRQIKDALHPTPQTDTDAREKVVEAFDPEDIRIVGEWIDAGEPTGGVPSGRIKGLWQSVRQALAALKTGDV